MLQFQEVQENPRILKLNNRKKKIIFFSYLHKEKKILSHFPHPLFPLSNGIAAVFSLMNFNKI